MKTENHKYPTELFVLRAGKPGDWYLDAAEKAEEHAQNGETRRVGKYVLLEVLTVASKTVITVDSKTSKTKK